MFFLSCATNHLQALYMVPVSIPCDQSAGGALGIRAFSRPLFLIVPPCSTSAGLSSTIFSGDIYPVGKFAAETKSGKKSNYSLLFYVNQSEDLSAFFHKVRVVEKPVEIVEKYEFSTAIPGFWSVTAAKNPALSGNITGKSGKQTKLCSRCRSVCFLKRKGKKFAFSQKVSVCTGLFSACRKIICGKYTKISAVWFSSPGKYCPHDHHRRIVCREK